MDVFAHVCGQKADTSSNYCDNIQPYDKRRFFFVKYDTIFRLFFGNYHDFQTSNFRKVVWQHTEGTVRSIIWILLEIYLAFQQWTNFENPLRIYKSYRHKFGVLLFWDTVYTRKLVSTSLVEHSINCWCLRLNSHCTGTRGMHTEGSKIGCLTKSTDWRNQWLN